MSAAEVLTVDGEPLVVALAGTVLQAADATGRRRWWLPRRVVSRIIAAGELTGSGAASILARGTLRELVLLDARTGRTIWTWWAPDGTFINDAGAVLLLPAEAGARLLVAPIYGSTIEAFDLSAVDPGRPAWTLHGTWDAGFGPSLIAADMDGIGMPRIVLSSRRGDMDRTHGGRHTTAETVLGKRHGLLYQAVVDAADGTILRETAWAPNPRGHRCARPYGLLTAVPFEPGGRPGIVMACCQVEEYLAVTRQLPDGTLERAWSRFVEKDWPTDRQELRVHPDSVRDLRRDGRPELVSSLWDGRRWRTSVQELASGRDRAGDRLLDRVLWGCLSAADGSTSLVVSESTGRPVRGPTTVELIDGASLEVVDRRRRAQVLVGAERLPGHVAFMADRRGLARVTVDSSEAVVVRDRGGALHAWWPDGRTGSRSSRIGTARDVLVSAGVGWTLVADRGGRIRRLGSPFGPTDPAPGLRTHGRVAPVAATRDREGTTVSVELPGARTRTVRPTGPGALAAHTVVGRQVALRVAANGDVLARALTRDRGGRTLLCLETTHQGTEPVTVGLDAPLDRPVQWMADGSLLITLRTGTHTLATEVREGDGTLRWRLAAGAYLHAPAAADLEEGPLVVLDDHGILHAVDGASGSGQAPILRWTRDWTAAYGQPIVGPFLPGGGVGILRANGIHGMELLDLAGRRRWRTEAPLWRYATGDAVVARASGGWMLVAGRRDGRLDGIDARDGRIAWSVPLTDALDDVALAAADLDGDGEDEVVVGLPDGRLVALGGLSHEPAIRWAVRLAAGVASIQALPARPGAGEPVTVLVVATVDGRVRLLDLPAGQRPAEPVRFAP
ncbi:MAG: PQQ-binding-like beta-propeller repeat protein [Chloroflexota bacterium]